MASSVPLVSVNSVCWTPKCLAKIFQRIFVFRIDAQIAGGQKSFNEIDDVRRRADGVLVKIEPQFIAPSATGRMIRRHLQHGFAGSQD